MDTKKDNKKSASVKYSAGALFLFYLMITIEIIMMASPFTAYYYVAYGPVLKFMDSHYLTKWMGAFFLPHMIFPANPVFIFIRSLCTLFFYGGILIFFAAAIPLYYRKFCRKGLVSGGMYKYVRHPQYFGLALWGLGLLLFWPRFFILVAYVVMLLLYYLLARNEESRFAPEDYEPYRQSTGMFFPRIKGLKLNFNPLAVIKNSSLRVGTAFVLTMVIAVGLGFVLRVFTVKQLPQAYLGNLRAISIRPMPAAKMKSIIQTVSTDPQVKSLIEPDAAYLVYIMPQDYKMAALVARLPDQKKQDKGRFHFMSNIFHHFAMGMQRHCCLKGSGTGNLRIIFLKVTSEDNSPVSPYETFDVYTQRTPVLYADIEPYVEKVQVVRQLPPGNKWGNLPQAVF